MLWIWFSPSMAAGWLSILLVPLSGLTRRASRKRREAIRQLPAPHPPVVVVGNLVVGGSGKTPLVIGLAKSLAERGWHPGIVCSGYRGWRTDARLVNAGDDATEHGDEAVLLAQAQAGTVAAGRNRAEALHALLSAAPNTDVVLADDGLQHPHLPRTLEVAVLDSRGLGNRRLLPAGPLREPSARLGEVDAVVVNGEAAQPDGARRHFHFTLNPTRFVPLVRTSLDTAPAASRANTAQQASGHREGTRAHAAMAATDFAAFARHRSLTAIAGIGHPERFFSTLDALGLVFNRLMPGDHARMDPALIASIPTELIVMTSKDAVKCTQVSDERCWVLEVSAEPDPAFIDWLIETLRGPSPA